ncbi:MAG TPA: hypothetical protein VFH95_13430 [Candidatus Kapabacteria bacterium]|nr:hypothetical protein [Candidatus Kapabacteria bacterium]
MDWRSIIRGDYERFAHGLPRPLEDYVLDTFGISLASEYAGLPIKNPFGKASGQLSLNANQVERDAEAGLGFVVLKTLIAEDETGAQSMKAWAIPATKMTVEEITGTREAVRDEPGWTVTWKGRGWSESFEAYREFFDRAIEIGMRAKMLVIPSVKYHLPKPGEILWRTDEYEFTTTQLHKIWKKHRREPMPLEKDFSPTLAGDRNFSREQENIVNWLRTVPRLIKATTAGNDVRLGLKIFNATFSDEFQREMLDVCEGNEPRADYIVYGNRLFDPEKSYEGTRGVAYGGPDLSDRNFSILTNWHHTLPLSATGNITTGRIAFEYLKRGATSFQMHTLFQLPDSEFAMKRGTRMTDHPLRTERALHRLLFHPEHGFLAAVLAEQEIREWPTEMSIPEIAKCSANFSLRPLHRVAN